jgi:ribonuclease HI
MIEIYTDGGCSGNPGPGGWAYIVKNSEKIFRGSGSEKHTTNNRMELTAVIRALEFLRGGVLPGKVRVTTDSQYVQFGITKWIKGWEKKGWKTADNKPVKNKDLWVQLKLLSDLLSPEWGWVKGHAGDPLNEECDAAVQKEIKKILF